MYNYKCPVCGHVFDEPHEYDERHGFTHGPAEHWSVCPNCGDPSYERNIVCDKCGDDMCESETHEVEDTDGSIIHVCDICYSDYEEDE